MTVASMILNYIVFFGWKIDREWNERYKNHVVWVVYFQHANNVVVGMVAFLP
jgi:hypothetical protein